MGHCLLWPGPLSFWSPNLINTSMNPNTSVTKIQWNSLHYSAPVGVRSTVINPSVCVCLSATISLELLDWSAWNFVCRSPVAVARSSSGGVALRYVLLVLWMTSHLAIMGATPKGGSRPSATAINDVVILRRSLMSMNIWVFEIRCSQGFRDACRTDSLMDRHTRKQSESGTSQLHMKNNTLPSQQQLTSKPLQQLRTKHETSKSKHREH